MLKDVSSYCRACSGCRVHCRGKKTCPVMPGPALVPFVSATSCKVCCKRAFTAPKIAHFTKYLFFMYIGLDTLPVFVFVCR